MEEIAVSLFFVNWEQYLLDPELKFCWTIDRESNFTEITGTGAYEDILIYGKNLLEAREILENEILPVLWEVYVNEDDSKLTQKAQTIKNDLMSRFVR